MNELLPFFKEYASVVNVGLIVSLMVISIYIFRAIIVEKDATFKALEERFKNVEIFRVSAVIKEFQALKYYNTYLQDKHESVIKRLEGEKRKAIESKEKESQLRIEEEIAKWKSVMKEYTEQKGTALETMPQWSRAQVCGTYAVVGKNPLKPQEPYFGELQIKERDEVLLGTWKFPIRESGASKQSDEGTGLLRKLLIRVHFLKKSSKESNEGIGLRVGNAIAFRYEHTGEDGTYTGVVLYEIMSDDLMSGQWAVFGESNVGFEECRKEKPAE